MSRITTLIALGVACLFATIPHAPARGEEFRLEARVHVQDVAPMRKS